MSSNESSGTSAEVSATNAAPSAAATFGSTRGSGLARGKGKRPSAPAASTAAPSNYTPTAIEVVTAPREYQNPFAPVETPVAATQETVPVAAPAPAAYVPPTRIERVEEVAPVKEYSAPSPQEASSSEMEAQAELNILPPEQQKASAAQTWESEGFRPAREPRNDRPRRDDSPRREEPRAERAPFDPSTIPAKFLYVRPGYNYVPTPSNYGSAPRERDNRPATETPRTYSAPTPSAETPKASGGFFGWLKSLFGGSPTPAPAPVQVRQDEPRNGDRYQGGRNRSQASGDGQRRRSRGGRGRSQRNGEYRSGSDQGSPSAT